MQYFRLNQTNTGHQPPNHSETPHVIEETEPGEGLNPYRGFDPHGVDQVAASHPTPYIDDKTLLHYTPPKPEPDPVPVRIVTEGGREINDFTPSIEYATNVARSIVGKNVDRKQITITNLGNNQTPALSVPVSSIIALPNIPVNGSYNSGNISIPPNATQFSADINILPTGATGIVGMIIASNDGGTFFNISSTVPSNNGNQQHMLLTVPIAGWKFVQVAISNGTAVPITTGNIETSFPGITTSSPGSEATVWLNNNNNVGIENGYPLKVGESVTWAVHTPVWGLSGNNDQQKLSVVQFISIPLDAAHTVNPGS